MPFLKPKIILLDTEQDKTYFGGSVKRIHWQANINRDLPHFTAYSMVDASVDERLAAVSSLIDENPDVGLFIIDGLLDMVKKYNDEEEASRLGEFLLKQKSKGVMIMIVCHRGDEGKPRESNRISWINDNEKSRGIHCLGNSKPKRNR